MYHKCTSTTLFLPWFAYTVHKWDSAGSWSLTNTPTPRTLILPSRAHYHSVWVIKHDQFKTKHIAKFSAQCPMLRDILQDPMFPGRYLATSCKSGLLRNGPLIQLIPVPYQPWLDSFDFHESCLNRVICGQDKYLYVDESQVHFLVKFIWPII